MPDFTIKFKFISVDGPVAKLNSLSGQEFTAPSDTLPSGCLTNDIVEIPLNSLVSKLDGEGRANLSRILIGCPND